MFQGNSIEQLWLLASVTPPWAYVLATCIFFYCLGWWVIPEYVKEQRRRARVAPRAAFRHWRNLVGCYRHFRREKPENWDRLYTLAVVADCCVALRLNFAVLLMVRAMTREMLSEGSTNFMTIKNYLELEKNFLNSALESLIGAGRSEQAVRLSEHIGSIIADGSDARLDRLPTSIGVILHSNKKMRLGTQTVGTDVPTDVPIKAINKIVTATRWLPQAIGQEIGGLCLLIVLRSLDVLGRRVWGDYNMIGRRYDLFLYQLPRRKAPVFFLTSEEVPTVRIKLAVDYDRARQQGGIKYVVQSPNYWGAGFEFKGVYGVGYTAPQFISLDPISLLNDICTFYIISRTSRTWEIDTPGNFTSKWWPVLWPAMKELMRGEDSFPHGRWLIALQTAGVLEAIPHAAIRDLLGHYLIEKFDLVYADGLPCSEPSLARQPITVLWGGKGLMHAHAEAKSILDLAIARNIEILNDRESDGSHSLALTRASLERALQLGGIVHLCTHFIPNLTNPIKSRLAAADESEFSLCDLLPSASSRRLEMVFISACESGVSGDVIDGLGGNSARIWRELFSAQSVISTIWRVRDAAAARFSLEFYKKLFEGYSRARSLAVTQLFIANENASPEIKSKDSTPRERFLTLENRPFNVRDDCENGTGPSRFDHDPRHIRNWAGFRLSGASGPLFPRIHEQGELP